MPHVVDRERLARRHKMCKRTQRNRRRQPRPAAVRFAATHLLRRLHFRLKLHCSSNSRRVVPLVDVVALEDVPVRTRRRKHRLIRPRVDVVDSAELEFTLDRRQASTSCSRVDSADVAPSSTTHRYVCDGVSNDSPPPQMSLDPAPDDDPCRIRCPRRNRPRRRRLHINIVQLVRVQSGTSGPPPGSRGTDSAACTSY